MEYWESYYANYPAYQPPYPPAPPPYPSIPPPEYPPEYNLSGASHLRCTLSDSDSESSTNTQRRDVHTSATKYAAVSCGTASEIVAYPRKSRAKVTVSVPRIQHESEGEVVDVPDSDSESENTTTSTNLPTVSNFSLQIINPNRKKDYRIIKVKPPTEYTLKKMQEVIEVHTSNKEFGYVEPGHGLKGKRVWIFTEEDVSAMVEKHRKKKELRFWCYSDENKSSTPHSPERGPENKKPHTSKYDSYVQKLAKVDEIFKELDEKHHGRLSLEQLNAWAHLVQSGKHASLDVPPDMPFFKGKEKKKDSNPPSTPPINKQVPSSPSQLTSSVGVSPGRRVGLRTECIDQLKKWHALLADGAITKAQYDDLQEKILNDMQKF